jgi:hypothetical protein
MDANVIDVALPVEIGSATFYQRATIDGVEWNKGDVFYVRDHYGVPRPVVFEYVCNGRVTCYSRQRYRRPGGATQPCGYTSSIMPSRTAVEMDPTELEFRQLAADLTDIGEDDEAARLLEVFAESGDAAELEQAKRRALQIIDAASDAPL